ncbi:DUF192 domain-containing protein [Curvibacter sp. APW13]|uniref:DUF192 domain-containing protein n=1 Tax=Curvibacter sp. APW13 TaxID=3077236 RepID=UPI0028DD9DF3|nr:DUF192 domain-containing protein [Curvibacter sp. APW13]MDT8992099.1 DUF192 domain-containing protein [Curvibacter sp. APW13]
MIHQRALTSIKSAKKKLRDLIPLALCWLCFSATAQGAGQAQMDLPRVQLSAGMHLIQAQVASTPHQREVGLMFRQEMPAGEGMLFVFDNASNLCFWMKNTVLPLTAAFIADDGTIINLEDMKPMTTDSHCAKRPARFVLEMNQGWFTKRGIAAGQKLSGPVFKQP